MTDTAGVAVPRITRYGDRARLVAFEGGLDLGVNDRVLALARRLTERRLPGVMEIVSASTTLAVHVAREGFDEEAFVEAVVTDASVPPAPVVRRTHRVPVCYDAPFALDLAAVADECRCSEDEVVARHLAVDYQVLMVGFLPGFPYLGLVDPRIAVPRRATPRLSIPGGSVGIAGRQTGVYPMESPGGWCVIGRTPIALFDPDREPAARLAAGDRVQFVRIDRAGFAAVDARGGW